MHHDERSAGFMALGVGLAGGLAVVVTTSGTAAVELHPAVIEAHQAGIPLIACTADRPPELQDVGAPQTVDQTHLYGRSTRWFHQPGVPDWEARGSWRSLAARSIEEAQQRGTGRPGPVHLDLAFREPLVGTPLDLPAGRGDVAPWRRTSGGADAAVGSDAVTGDLRDLLERTAGRGIIVAGARAPAPVVRSLGSALGWPVLAGARCALPSAHGASLPEGEPVVVHGFDALLRTAFAADHRPRAVLWLGERPASKVLGEWVVAADAHQVTVRDHGRLVDPAHSVAEIWTGGEGAWYRSLLGAARRHDHRDRSWQQGWASAAASAADAVDGVLAAHDGLTEPGVARALTAAAAAEGGNGTPIDLVVSSSMPIRDVEWFGAFDAPLDVLANRGANGIDGVVSTAVGVALQNRRAGRGRRTALLVGDIALLHDTNGLLGLRRRDLDLTIVVLDNDGGGIFSFLPQRRALAPDRFEQLFGTPHGVDLAALAAAHDLPLTRPAGAAEAADVMAKAIGSHGTEMIVIETDRDANVKVHDELGAAVAARLGVAAPTG